MPSPEGVTVTGPLRPATRQAALLQGGHGCLRGRGLGVGDDHLQGQQGARRPVRLEDLDRLHPVDRLGERGDVGVAQPQLRHR